MRKRMSYVTKKATAVTLSLAMTLSPVAAGMNTAGTVLAAEIPNEGTEDDTSEDPNDPGETMGDGNGSGSEKTEDGGSGSDPGEGIDDESGSGSEAGSDSEEDFDGESGSGSEEDAGDKSETGSEQDTTKEDGTGADQDVDGEDKKDSEEKGDGENVFDGKTEEEKTDEIGEKEDAGDLDETKEDEKPEEVQLPDPEVNGELKTGSGDKKALKEERLEVLEELEDDDLFLYDWKSEWEEDMNTGDVMTKLDFSSSDNPANVMKAFGTGDSKNNIEGPEGSNCYVDGAKNWKDNGNLMVVDLASASNAERIEETFGESYARSYEEDFEEAAEGAEMSLGDPHVFRYYLHDLKDWDRNTSITDRQRIEIKTEAKNADVNSYEGEILTNRWKFFLPACYKDALPYDDTGTFFHIFQTKATQGDESSMPVFTLSVTEDNLYMHGSDCGHVNQVEYEIASVDIDDVLGRWIEAEITTYTAEKGYVYVKLQDVSDPFDKVVLMEEGYEMDNWRRPEKLMEDGLYHEYDEPAVRSQMNRSKWGIYRENDTPRPYKDMAMYLGDLQVIKRNADRYVFPDGFDPKEQTRDVTWAISPEPVKVLEGTDFSNIYLPSKVQVYVEAHDIETVPVTWEAGTYDQSVKGTYTVYGTLQLEDGLENPDDVKASAQITVTDDISQKRVNWALSQEAGGTAQVKTVSGSGSNPSVNMIDGREDTFWATHSGLIAVNTEDNGGWRYWAAVDLGEERTFDEIYYALGTIGSSKQFRLKNYSMYYTDDRAAYEELQGGSTGNPREKEVTPDPLATEHGDSWEMIPGVYKTNADGAKQVTNNIKHSYQLEEALTARYILVYGEIENVNATAGAIQTKVLKIIGNKACEDIPEIVEVEAGQPVYVVPGTDFASLGLPAEVAATLSDGTKAMAFATWSQDGYMQDQEGSYRIEGMLTFPEDQMQNPECLRAYASVIVEKPQETGQVNWASEKSGAVIKAVSDNKSYPVNSLIDEDDTNQWQTNSSLITYGKDLKYWAVLDLGQERNVDQIRLAWGNTGSRLKNYHIYYAEGSEKGKAAFEGLSGLQGTINDTNVSGITGDPLNIDDFGWKKLDKAGSDSIVKNNTMVNATLEDRISCRYLMLYSDLDTEKTKGAVSCTMFEACGSLERETKEIKTVADTETVSVAYGTPFGEIELPEMAEVKLEDGSLQEVPVIWNRGSYSRTQTGTVWVEGTLLLPSDLTNSAKLKASIQINIEGEEIARKATVVFMSSADTEYLRRDNVIVGSKIAAPVNAPQKDGFIFDGWYRDGACTIPWDHDNDRLTASGLILYAKWKKAETEEPVKPVKPSEPWRSEPSGDEDGSDTDGNDNVSQSENGSWRRDAKGWWYSFANESYPNGKWEKLYWNGRESWYYFGADGYMKTGWYEDLDGHMYYLNPVSDGTQGEMWTGWHQMEGVWYYFNPVSDGTQGALLITDQEGTADHKQ